MQSFGVVVHLNVFKYFTAGILCCPESATFQHFSFETGKEGFHVGVVIGVICIAHALQNIMFCQFFTKVGPRILASPVRMQQQSLD